ncbi:MAG: ATP-binding protein, partial [Armatimonadetes bacterium]|nr:ATP-binding protein [Armatimonadota bacterium]
ARPHGIEIQQVDVNREVAAALKLLEIKDTGEVKIHSEFAHVPKAKADPFALQEVIINLCTNAIEAMPHGGTLTVRTYPTSFKLERSLNGVGIDVIDTGEGITPEEKELIFEPFYSSRSTSEGTGLGLWMCQMLVSQMGGLIEVESTPGKGSTFTVVLQAH